jgi:ABC-2 type transport system ATP-binding protein
MKYCFYRKILKDIIIELLLTISMISIQNLTKTYKTKPKSDAKKSSSITALNRVNLDIFKGEIFGIIGPNGAGKTTLLKILSTLILPDSGTALINGKDILKDENYIKNNTSLLAGEFVRSLYWRLSGRENIRFFAKLKNVWDAEERIDYLFGLFGLTDYENELVMKYSTGMKHKLALAVGLVNDPPVIFLDEPLTGIDPITSYEIKKIIRDKFKDKTIIWTTHNLFEIEEMCDRIALLNKGNIVLKGSPEVLKKRHWGYEKIRVSCDKPEFFSFLENAEIKNGVVEVKTRNFNDTVLKIMKIVKDNNITISDIQTMRPTLEEIFMKGLENV